MDVKLRSMSGRHIDVSIRHLSKEHRRCTGIYGWSEHSQKRKTWELLEQLGKESDMAWLIGGDFNYALYAHEKKVVIPVTFYP